MKEVVSLKNKLWIVKPTSDLKMLKNSVDC